MRIDDKPSPSTKRNTKAELLAAAAREFNTRGFGGTDTNRIARAAGFAPQTFYRHYADKTDIFIHVYEKWQEDERARIALAMRSKPDSRGQALAVATTLIEAHGAWALFRRSLRLLAVEDPRVRTARAASRRAQLAVLRNSEGEPWAKQVAALLTVERLCDAAADDEIDDLAIPAAAWVSVVAEALAKLQRPAST